MSKYERRFKPTRFSPDVRKWVLVCVLSFMGQIACGRSTPEESDSGGAGPLCGAKEVPSVEGFEPEREAAGEREDRSGAFRTHCLESHTSFDDPLVFPDVPDGAHHHVFFGNPDVDAFTKVEALKTSECGTCDGGTVNHSAYWVPALYDQNGERIEYVDPLFYYKTGYHLPATSIVPPPEGLVMIAGDMHATAPQSTTIAKFRCGSWTSDQAWFDPGDPLDHVAFLPDCPVGDMVEIRIVFPQCWDGVNLDSPDHRSHMAYPSEATPPVVGTGSCPSSHPTAIPEISYNFAIRVTEESGPPTSWRFSSDHHPSAPPGSSIHADWMNGWDREIMETIVEECLNPARECLVGLLGDGRQLVQVVRD